MEPEGGVERFVNHSFEDAPGRIQCRRTFSDLTAGKARAVLVGNTAELSPDRCCPNCGMMLCAASSGPLLLGLRRRETFAPFETCIPYPV